MNIQAALLAGLPAGQFVCDDAAIVDGSAHMTTLLQAAGQMQATCGQNLLDGPHWYNTYRCADRHFISVGSVEQKFYRELCERLGLQAEAGFQKGSRGETTNTTCCCRGPVASVSTMLVAKSCRKDRHCPCFNTVHENRGHLVHRQQHWGKVS